MIVILKPNTPEDRVDHLIKWLTGQGLGTHVSEGEYHTVIGLIGDTSRVDLDLLQSLDIVESARRVSDPYKLCNRKFHPDDTVIDVDGAKIGGGHFALIAGPCSVESEEQIIGVAKAVKAAGATMLVTLEPAAVPVIVSSSSQSENSRSVIVSSSSSLVMTARMSPALTSSPMATRSSVSVPSASARRLGWLTAEVVPVP